MRELKVEDALLYLDQVKVEFGDQPHIYNEFLDIMKTFKTQQIDTPGVIRRVSNLFRGNRRLVLGFNTFLPEGYKIELPEGDGPAVAVYRAPGSSVAHVLSEGQLPPRGPMPPQQAPMHPGPPPARPGLPPVGTQQRSPGPPPRDQAYGQPMQHAQAHPPLGPPPGQSPLDGAPRPPPPPPPHHAHAPPVGAANSAASRPPQPQEPIPPQPRPPGGFGDAPTQQGPQQAQQQQGAAAQGEQPGVMEFDHAINYVTTIKKRFSSEPYTYKKFLEILHTYQKEQRGIKEVLDEVSVLFADHPDLLREFTYFLPDAVQSQAKARLDEVAKEAEARKRGRTKPAGGAGRKKAAAAAHDRNAKQHQPIPFGASQGRSVAEENGIIRGAHYGIVSFAPVRPPIHSALTPSQAAAKFGRPTAIPELPLAPNTSETAFFKRAKEHLLRKELSADKPTGPKRNTPYAEFLKCLHLFGAGIINKDELMLLLKGLFMQGHAPKSGVNAGGGNCIPQVAQDATDLLRDFEELLIGRGPYARQEADLKDRSKYGGKRMRDFDFTGCEHPTPSYWAFPGDYPQSLFISNPGQSEVDASVLNDKLVCLVPEEATSPMTLTLEAYDGVRMRRNAYEDVMSRIEDERFELDMAIERNSQALRQIEPYAEEARRLREKEEQDGQPIGRLQYQLNRYALNTIHTNAIGRLYGEKGDEVLQHLLQNPVIVLPIVFQRLKQKDEEWRSAKAELIEQWNACCAANYEGAIDHLCYFKRRALEQRFSKTRLLDDCKRARTYCVYPERVKRNPATDAFIPEFRLSCPDPASLLFQPHATVKCKVDSSHKEALQLVVERVKHSGVSAFDRERIGRIWSEFVVPWFDYPAHWVLDEVRASFGGKLNHSVVKYALGQRVETIFGEGSVLAFTGHDEPSGPKYRVKLAFGTAYVNPSAILYAVPSKQTPYIRRDGSMVRDERLIENGSIAPKLHEKFEMLFGTESIYLFMRLYLVLCELLADIRQHCEAAMPSEDPATTYCRPTKASDPGVSEALNYSSVLSSLQKVMSGQMSPISFETFGRKVSKEKVYEMAALPKLIERCTGALVATAQEDCLLHLYDYCQYRQVDPVAVRTHCFAVSPEAVYRIQYDTTTGLLFFNFLPKSSEILTAPQPVDGSTNQMEETQSADVSMAEDDPNDDSDEEGEVSGGRPTKRTRV